MKHTPLLLLLLLSLILPSSLPAQTGLTVARRIRMIVADMESPEPTGALFSGLSVADELEIHALESPALLEKIILTRRSEGPKDLTGLRTDDLLGILKKTERWQTETVLAGRINREEDGAFSLILQVIDIQKKNIPATRRILNYVEVRAIPNSADGLETACRQAIRTLETAEFPRVDIITPNFDVISIQQINKDSFPEIRLSVSVVNKEGDPVSVPPELFEVRENGNMVLADIRKIRAEERAENPVTLVLAIDRSPSMLEETDGRKTGEPFRRAKAAAKEFISRLSPHDRIKIIAFDYETVSLGEYSTDHAAALRALDALQVGRGTGLFNVVKTCVEELAQVRGQKAVILLTDGRNDVRNASDAVKAVTLEQGLAAAQKLSVPVYTIGFGDADRKVLQEIADKTHSIFFKAAGSEQLRELYLKLHNIIENQYIITYRSLAVHSGKVTVGLNVKEDERAFELTAEEEAAGLKSRTATDGLRQTRKAEQERLDLETARKEIQSRTEDLESEAGKLDALKTELAQREANLTSKEADLQDREKKIADLQKAVDEQIRKTGEADLRLKESREKMREIETNIRRTNDEILDFLKKKSEYLSKEQEKLDKLKEDIK